MEDDDYGGYDDQDYDYEFRDDEEQQQQLDEDVNNRGNGINNVENERNQDEDDDQKQQKRNGQFEAVQEQLRKCELELSQVNDEHDETKKQLSEAMAKIEDLKAKISSQQMLKEELKEANEKIVELQLQLKESKKSSSSTTAAGGTHDKLMQAFMNFSTEHSLDNPAMDITEMNETICIRLLNQITKKLHEKNLKKSSSFVTNSQNASDTELQQRIRNLEEELRLALGAAEDIRALKAKAISLVERIRLEKEDKLRCEAEQKVYIKKIEMLSDHVEKLMIHLKHEAAAKIKTMDQLRASEKRNETAQLKLGIVSRKAAAKDRLIAELREGSKILEDQLRLMDEKYLELRTKLDYAREVAAKKVKIAQKTASDLRVKFALAGNTKLLDHIPLPDIHSASTGGGGSAMGTGDYGFTDGYGTNDYSKSMPALSMTSPQPLLRSMGGSSNNLLKSSTSSAGGTSGRKKSKKKSSTTSSSTIAKDTEQSTERVLDKIRRLRGGQQEWTEEKIRNLVKSH